MLTPLDIRFTGTVDDLLFLYKALESAHKVAYSQDSCVVARNKPSFMFDLVITVNAEGDSLVSVTRNRGAEIQS